MYPKNNASDLFRGGIPGEPIHQGKSEGELLEIMFQDAYRYPLKERSIEEPVLLDKTIAVRHPGEHLLSFVARSGLSPLQIRELTTDQISKHVAQQEINSHEMEREPAFSVEP